MAAALADVHEALGQAYESAAAVLASGHASPAATEARRILEGLVKHLLIKNNYEVPERAVLSHLLKELSNHVDLARPLTDTAEAVKGGGNLAAHFDMNRTATSAMAKEALTLVEAMVDYLLILPRRVEALHEHLDSGTNEAPSDGVEEVGQ